MWKSTQKGTISFLEVDLEDLATLHSGLDPGQATVPWKSLQIGMTTEAVINFGYILESSVGILKMLMPKPHLDQLNKNS